jgi:signal transduction histidine kinase
MSQDLHRQYQHLLQRLEANEREFRRLGRAVWRVQEDERRRLARELHDGLGQNLTALKQHLAQVGGPLGEAGRAHLDAAIRLCSDALEDTRNLTRLLRPPILDDLGLVPALEWLARAVGESSGLEVVVELGEVPPLDGELETLLFRIAQEALSNAARHAQARSVLLHLAQRGQELQLQVVDDGRGFDPAAVAARGGNGLGGMRERLRLHDGRLELLAAPGRGTRLRAVVPMVAS